MDDWIPSTMSAITRPRDFDRFRDGDKIVVGVEPGALGIPWFYGVYRQGNKPFK
jgi:hypothetical protein